MELSCTSTGQDSMKEKETIFWFANNCLTPIIDAVFEGISLVSAHCLTCSLEIIFATVISILLLTWSIKLLSLKDDQTMNIANISTTLEE